MYKIIIKNILDIIVSFVCLVCISPIFVIIILCLFIENKNFDVFFIQERPGRNEKLFKLVKFKTMEDKWDDNDQLLPDVQRITKTGKILRKTSLDEIPQLINIIKGDMSLIGPRPLLPEYLKHYNESQKRRHEVKPGITGWAQVNGRNTISWEDKFKYDIWYVDNITFCLDIKIFFMTIKRVIFKEGINKSDKETMEMFSGDDK